MMNLDMSKVDKQTSLLDIKKATTPGEFASFLRAQGEIFYWDAARFYVVSDLALGREVMKNPAFSADRSSFFISRMPNMDLRLIKDFFSLVQKMMVMSDGKSHEERRKAAAIGIDGELLEYYKPVIEETVRSLVQAAAAKGEFDFVKDIAERLPSLVLADLFCIPEADREKFYINSVLMTQFFGGASGYENKDGIPVNEAAIFIRDYFRQLLQERRLNPKKDFFSVLLVSQARFSLSDDEIISQAVMMLVAGQVTTTDQLNNNLYTMLQTGSLETLRANPSLIPLANEEFNRLDPGVTFVFRTVKTAVNLGGVNLKPEDVVFVSTHAVNRDPVVFENPNACVLDRAVNPHFAFGHGPHFCLGARLARMQMQICMEQMVQLKGLSFVPGSPPVRSHYALSFSGFEILPLTKPKEIV